MRPDDEEDIEDTPDIPEEDVEEEYEDTTDLEEDGDGVLTEDEEIVELNFTITACLNENSANFYEYTPYRDCDGAVIPATYIENPSQAKWIDCGCPDCNLNLSITYGSPSTFGGTDGYITAGVIGEDIDPISETFGDDISTGTANYTYVIEPVNAEDPGKGAGSTIGSGAVSNTKFTFGYNIDLEQTGTIDNATYAASSIKGYVPAVATIGEATKGLEAGTYNVYVFDANTTSSCLARSQITLVNPPRIAGCTDNNAGTNDGAALNFSTNAGIDNKSCIYCKAADGKLVDYQSKNYLGTGDIIESFNINIQEATDSDNTDGVIQFSATPISVFQTYIENVVDAYGNVDAAYKLELYPLTETQFKNKTISGATKLGSTVSNTDEGSKFNYTFNSINGYDVTYGRYAVKIFIDDPDDGEIDGCYQLRFLTVPVLVGQDKSKPNTFVTADSVTITNKELVVVTSQLEQFANTPPCCESPTLTFNNIAFWAGGIQNYVHNGTTLSHTYGDCAWGLILDFDCSQDANNSNIEIAQFQLQYDHPVNGWEDVPEVNTSCTSNCLIPDPLFPSASVGIPQNYPGACCLYSFSFKGPAHPPWINNSQQNSLKDMAYSTYFTQTDSLPDGDYRVKQIIVDSSNNNCIKYTNAVTVVALICGCTDATATNYNATATHDDNSCTYPPTIACPPLSPTTLTVATVDSTGDCTAPNNDGTATVTVSVNTGITTWTIRYRPSGGSWSAWSSVYTSNGPATTETGLAPGGYEVEVEDSSGCFTTITYSIGNSTSGCGCTDLNATNYDPTATQDDGSCLYAGCTNPKASNYNPNATTDDGSCIYAPVSGSTSCIPPYISQLSTKIKTCIAESGYNFYHELILGEADNCLIMNSWKLILIDYLLELTTDPDLIGLDCIYNCADSGTPNVNTLISYESLWITGGPSTGLNDMAQAGSTITTGEGTTVATLATFFVVTNTLYEGDIIKMPSGLTWVVDGPQASSLPSTGFTLNNSNPETSVGQSLGVWKLCNDAMNQISFSNTTNYLDIFSSFVNKFCDNCETYSIDQNIFLIPNKLDSKDNPPNAIEGDYGEYLY